MLLRVCAERGWKKSIGFGVCGGKGIKGNKFQESKTVSKKNECIFLFGTNS